MTHRMIQADWMSHVMNGSVYVFFSSMYAAGVVVLLNLLRHIDNRLFGFYTYAPLWKKKRVRQGAFVLTLVVFVACLFIGHYNVRYPQVIHQDLYLTRLTKPGEQSKAEKTPIRSGWGKATRTAPAARIPLPDSSLRRC